MLCAAISSRSTVIKRWGPRSCRVAIVASHKDDVAVLEWEIADHGAAVKALAWIPKNPVHAAAFASAAALALVKPAGGVFIGISTIVFDVVPVIDCLWFAERAAIMWAMFRDQGIKFSFGDEVEALGIDAFFLDRVLLLAVIIEFTNFDGAADMV